MLKENICEKRAKSKLKGNERKMRSDKNDDKLTLNDCNRKKIVLRLHFCRVSFIPAMFFFFVFFFAKKHGQKQKENKKNSRNF